jgi:hypothetical protein
MTATLSPSGPPPLVVRIRPAPSFEPPADDTRHPDDQPDCAGQLALFTSLHREIDEPVARGVPARGVPGAGAGRGGLPGNPTRPGVPAGFTRPGTPAGAGRRPGTGGGPPTTADPQAAASRFVGVCVEILNGFRPVAHLRSLTTPFDYASVTRQLTRRAMRIRMPARRPRTAEEQVALLCLRVCELHGGVAEAAAVLHVNGASWAVALRFEQRRGSWLCTLLQVV